MPLVRGYIVDLDNNESQLFALNPQNFEETYSANWTMKDPLASPNQRPQFKNTTNPTLPLELVYNRAVIAELARRRGSYDEALLRRALPRAKAFYMSFVYPRQHRGSALLRSPPQVLVVIPKVLSWRCGTTNVRFRNEEFDKNHELVQFTVTLEFFEIVTTPKFADEIRRVGSLRGSQSGTVTVD